MRKKKWCKPRIPSDSSITITFIVHYRGCCPSAHNCQNCYTTESRILTISLSHNLTILQSLISLSYLQQNCLPIGTGRGGGEVPWDFCSATEALKRPWGSNLRGRQYPSSYVPNLKTPHTLVLGGGRGTIGQ